MPGAKDHSHITENALKLVSFDIGDTSELISKYCNYPDFYPFDLEKIKDYYFETDGIQFHYLPDPPYNNLYRYWGMKNQKVVRMKSFRNDHFIHAKAGFFWYLEHAVSALRKNQPEEGKKFLGSLLHVLEDSTFGVHTLEGNGGSDIFLMNRIFESDTLPLSFLTKISALDFSAPDHTPRSLGNSVPEIVMNLYADYCRKLDSSRKAAYRIIKNGVEGKPFKHIAGTMFDNAVTLCADVIYSVFQVAAGIVEPFSDLPLHELYPFEMPCGGFRNYNLRTIERNRAYLPDGTEIPLELNGENGTVPVEEGFSFGSHFEGALRYWIAPETFREFSAQIGLHPAYTGTGEIVFEILNDGVSVERIVLDQENRSAKICIENPKNELALQFCSTSSCGIVVLANPMLKR